MQFDKPKVTIDLEEYQYLKDRVNGMDSDEMVLASKKSIAAILNNGLNWERIVGDLKSQNILLILSHHGRSNYTGKITPEDISISKVEPAKTKQ